MGLAEHAKRVAAEFEFGPENVRQAVKEFIREMGTLCPACAELGHWDTGTLADGPQTKDSRQREPS